MEDTSYWEEIVNGLAAGVEIVWAFTWAYTKAIWKCIVDLLNEPFALNLIGVAVAAFAGTYGAQWIIKRNKEVDDDIAEVRQINVATAVLFEFCTAYLNLKRQHVQNLCSVYHRDRKAFFEFQNRLEETGEIPPQPFEYVANLTTLDPMANQLDLLKENMFRGVVVSARALAATNTLIRSSVSLNSSIERRNSLILAFKSEHLALFPELKVKCFFGYPISETHVDRQYYDTIVGIGADTDNCIFYSKLIIEDLVERAEELKEKLGKKAPKIGRPNFSKADEEGLMPDPEKFKDWVNSFIIKEDKPSKLNCLLNFMLRRRR